MTQSINNEFNVSDIIVHKYHKHATYYLVEASYKDLVLIYDYDWTASKKYFRLITDIFEFDDPNESNSS